MKLQALSAKDTGCEVICARLNGKRGRWTRAFVDQSRSQSEQSLMLIPGSCALIPGVGSGVSSARGWILEVVRARLSQEKV